MSDTVTISKKAPLRVATWSELEDRVPAYALALQTDLVVIRLGDEVSVLYGRCLHRGALMADGRIEGDNLICGLHGWDYRVDTGVSAYANDEILHRFDARIDPSEDAVFIEEADVRAFQRVHPQPYDREAYLGLYQDPHGAPEEDVNGYIQRLAREGLEVPPGLVSDAAPLWPTISALMSAGEIHCMRDATRGGVATVVAELARATGLGARLDEEAIPVRPEVSDACELLGLDPLYVACEGRFVAFVPEAALPRALDALRAFDAQAALIGQVREAHPGVVTIRGPLGGERVLDIPNGEQLPDPRGRDEDSVALAALDDLRVAGHDAHAARLGRRGHGAHDPREGHEREALLQDEARGQVARSRAAHRQIVDRAVHREGADVAAREEERTDGEGVGGHHRDAGEGQRRRVVRAGRVGAEGSQEELLDQALHHAATAAVGQGHVLVGAEGDGAARLVGHAILR